MTEEERFDLIADIFAAAYLRICMEDIRARMDAEAAENHADKSAIHSESSLELLRGSSPNGGRK
jgi:hypothetical protein